jgi:hypothetical protein
VRAFWRALPAAMASRAWPAGWALVAALTLAAWLLS